MIDHSNILCNKIVAAKCPNGHARNRKCYEAQLASCQVCETDDLQRQRGLEIDKEFQDKRDMAKATHLAHISHLEQEIRQVRERNVDRGVALERERALVRKKRDLEAAKHMAQDSPIPVNHTRNGSTPFQISPIDISEISPERLHKRRDLSQHRLNVSKSDSELEWERQKVIDGASNEAIDALMALTGLESVKRKVLAIKAKIETILRQGIEHKEQLSVAMLGNPGTGR